MNDLDAAIPCRVEHLVHARGHNIYALRGAPAPVFIPHVTDEDGDLRGRQRFLSDCWLPIVVTGGVLGQALVAEVKLVFVSFTHKFPSCEI